MVERWHLFNVIRWSYGNFTVSQSSKTTLPNITPVIWVEDIIFYRRLSSTVFESTANGVAKGYRKVQYFIRCCSLSESWYSSCRMYCIRKTRKSCLQFKTKWGVHHFIYDVFIWIECIILFRTSLFEWRAPFYLGRPYLDGVHHFILNIPFRWSVPFYLNRPYLDGVNHFI